MSTTENYSPIKTLGNGVTTDFSGLWTPLKPEYLVVLLESVATGIQTTQVMGTNYSAVLTATGFTVSFVTPPTGLFFVVIGRRIPKDQTNPYTTSSGYQGIVLENSLDKLSLVDQDMQEQINRAIKLPFGSPLNLQLPAVVPLGLLGFNADGSNLTTYVLAGTGTYPVTPFIATLLDDNNATAARATLGLGNSATLNKSDLLFTTSAAGTANALTASFSPVMPLLDKATCFVVAAAANTSTTPTLVTDGNPARTITKLGGMPLYLGDISGAGHVLALQYNLASTRWELLNPAVPLSGPRRIQTVNISPGTAFVSILDLVPGKNYKILMHGLFTSTVSIIYLDFSADNGATWITTGSQYVSFYIATNATAVGTATGTANRGFSFANGVGTSQAISGFGEFDLIKPADPDTVTHYFGKNMYQTGAAAGLESCDARFIAAGAHNAIRIAPNLGTLSGGRIEIWEINP